MNTPTKKFRIWAQGATDQIGHRTYLAKLLPHMQACLSPDFELAFHTITPSVTTVHALSEFRFSRQVIRNAIQAEKEGCDVFFMNHFQDVGLYDAKASADDKSLPIDQRAKAEWDAKAEIRAEFASFESYLALRKAEDSGRVRVLGKKAG